MNFLILTLVAANFFSFGNGKVIKFKANANICGTIHDVGECATEFGKGVCFEINKDFYFFEGKNITSQQIQELQKSYVEAEKKSKSVAVCVNSDSAGLFKRASFKPSIGI